MFKAYVLRSESKHVFQEKPSRLQLYEDTAARMLLWRTGNYTDVMVFLILKASSEAYKFYSPEGSGNSLYLCEEDMHCQDLNYGAQREEPASLSTNPKLD